MSLFNKKKENTPNLQEIISKQEKEINELKSLLYLSDMTINFKKSFKNVFGNLIYTKDAYMAFVGEFVKSSIELKDKMEMSKDKDVIDVINSVIKKLNK